MRKTVMAATALLAASSPAFAALNNVTFIASAGGVQGFGAGFESQSVGALTPGYSEFGLTFTPGGSSVQVKTAPNDGNGAFPFGDTSIKYLSVLGGSSVVITPDAPTSRLAFYWGSIDDYNSVDFFNSSNVRVASLTGLDLAPLQNDGGQFDFNTNRYITLNLTAGTYSYAVLSSGANSFEIDNISAGVPEPSTWAMMLIGFAGLAFASRRKDRRIALAA